MKWSLPPLFVVCMSVGLRAHPGHEPAGFLAPEPGGAGHHAIGKIYDEERTLFLAPEPGGAGHHAIGEIYDEERTIVLSGEVESFLFGNPHSLLHVRILDDAGRARTWAVEWRAANRLSRAGLSGEALAPGDAVTLCGHPGRDPGAYRLYLLNVARHLTGSMPSAEARAAFCEREASPAITDLPVRSSRESATGIAAR
jgi:hypothetical protein